MFKIFVVTGSLFAALAVIMGAFAAHGLKTQLSADMLKVFHTGVQYHMYHALGLILVGISARLAGPAPLIAWSGAAMTVGILLFSGSLYLLATTGPRWLGAITPLGGMAFIASWLLLAIAIWRTTA